MAFVALFAGDYEVHEAVSNDQATDLVTKNLVDCAIVDLAQGANARGRLDMLRAWRAGDIDVPIVATSAVDDMAIAALTAGADDFLRKPFHFVELEARVRRHVFRGLNGRRVTNRVDGIQLPEEPFQFAGATIQPDLLLSFGKMTKRIGAKHVGILREFAAHAGQLVLKEALVRAVWGADANTNCGSVHQYLHVLRKLYREGGVELSDFVKPESKVGWRVSPSAVAICAAEKGRP